MAVGAVREPGTLLDAYRHHPARAAFDEVVDAAGVRPHQGELAAAIEAHGLPGLLAARSEARGFVLDEGVVYGSPDQRTSRLWSVDPLPVVLATREWEQLQAGLDQRARLLDLLLADLYGERTLVRRRILPAAAVLGHPGFARQADRVAAPTGRRLMLASTDLGRDASGGWRVISDRTEAPYGTGYAMVTRRIVSRVMAGLHRTSDLARLRGFFHTMTSALMDAAPRQVETPRVVVLSPGPGSETAFDTSFLSTMLGFPVAEADDLLTSHGRVWLRAGDRLEPVDVVVRRVSGPLSDPLEFRGDSQVGIPGLIEAARNGRVAVVNPVGSGVLDNPALLAYLEQVSEAVLGQPLRLSSPQTWWCGEPASLSHVLANLDHLVVKPVARGHASVVYGWELTTDARAALADRLRAEPWLWCGQEPLTLSTAPVVTPGGLEPRRFVLRAFGVAASEGYEFLPGGLGRVTGSTRERTVAGRTGVAKDVWVPAAAVRPAVEPDRLRPRLVAPAPARVPPRVAGTLVTIGRYAERAEATARLLRIAADLAEDHASRRASPGAAAMRVLLTAAEQLTGVARAAAEPEVEYLRRAALDPALPGGVAASVGVLIEGTQHVRDLMSLDTWSVFGRLELTLAAESDGDHPVQALLDDVLESLLAYAGILSQSMVRDSSWAFLDAGGRLERARRTVDLLGATMLSGQPAVVTELVADAVLRVCESVITHRRRAAAGTGPAEASASVFALLLQDESNPRSVAHQLAALAADLRLVGDDALATQANELRARLAAPIADPAQWLAGLTTELASLDARIAARHFVRQATRHSAESLQISWRQDDR